VNSKPLSVCLLKVTLSQLTLSVVKCGLSPKSMTNKFSTTRDSTLSSSWRLDVMVALCVQPRLSMVLTLAGEEIMRWSMVGVKGVALLIGNGGAAESYRSGSRLY
jgi:hypothetical protein